MELAKSYFSEPPLYQNHEFLGKDNEKLGEIDLLYDITICGQQVLLLIEVKCPSTKKTRRSLATTGKKQLKKYKKMLKRFYPDHLIITSLFDVYNGFDVQYWSSNTSVNAYFKILNRFRPPIMSDKLLYLTDDYACPCRHCRNHFSGFEIFYNLFLVVFQTIKRIFLIISNQCGDKSPLPKSSTVLIYDDCSQTTQLSAESVATMGYSLDIPMASTLQVVGEICPQSAKEPAWFNADTGGELILLRPIHIGVVDARFLYYVGIFSKSDIIEYAIPLNIWEIRDHVHSECLRHGIDTVARFRVFVQTLRISSSSERLNMKLSMIHDRRY